MRRYPHPALVEMASGFVIVVVLLLSFTLGGCASILQFAADTAGVDVVSESAKQKAFKAAKIAFTAWGGPLCQIGDLRLPTCRAGGVQGLALIYGGFDPCDHGEPDTYLCRDSEVWAKIKEITHRTSALLASTEPLIRAGSDDVSLLLSLPAAVYDAQEAINAAQQEGS